MREVLMIYSDEKDYVMRMIKEMARVIFSLAFDKTYVSVEMVNTECQEKR